MLKYYTAIKKGLKKPVNKTSKVLYVGASHGITVEKLSEQVEIIYALDISKETTKELLKIAKNKKNIAPILADANLVEEYDFRIGEVNFIFQDIAQKDQVRIFKKIMNHFKISKGWLALKCKGIDVRKTPEKVLDEALKELKDYKTKYVKLSPEIKDHYLIEITSS